MSRLSVLAWSLALFTFGAGAIGYAATSDGGEVAAVHTGVEQIKPPATPAMAERLRAPDAVLAVPQGETPSVTLLKAGASSLDAALAGKLAGEPEQGRPLRLWFGPALRGGTRPIDRLELRLGGNRKLVISRQGEEFVRSEVAEWVDDTPVRLRLDGRANVAAAMIDAGLSRQIRSAVADRLEGQRVASVDLIVAHEQTAGGSDFGAPLYLGLHLTDGSVRRWMEVGGELRLLRTGKSSAGLLQPVPGPVTSEPGLRLHPILRYLRWHRGTDFAAPSGTPVQAALAGWVLEAGWRGGYGRTVRLAHGDGSVTLYAHLRSIAVEEGADVPQGAIIGEVGASGLATGPHLHFEWLRGSQTLRPAFAPVHGDQLRLAPSDHARLQALLTAPFRLSPGRAS